MRLICRVECVYVFERYGIKVYEIKLHVFDA
jgi:hypothetical protein